VEEFSKKINLGSILISLLFGVIAALLAYKYMDYPLIYTDFIAGSITWEGEGKSKEVSLVFSFILTVGLSLIALSKFQSWVSKNYNEKVSQYFSMTLLYSVIPFVIWFGEQVLSKRAPNFELLYFNAWIVLGGIIATLLILKPFNPSEEKHQTNEMIVFSFIIFTFATLASNIVGTVFQRFGSEHILKNIWTMLPTIWLIALYFSSSNFTIHNSCNYNNIQYLRCLQTF